MTLEEARQLIGQKVIYQPHGQTPYAAEEGVITSVSRMFVFVRYGSNVHSKATAPELLEPLRRSPAAEGGRR